MTVVDLSQDLWSAASHAEDQGHIDTAVRLYEQAARMGVNAAQRNLGNLLDKRENARSRSMAIHWYVQAFRAGDELAAWNLAMRYVPGGNHRWYRFWMRKAAELGDPDAVAEMAKIDANPGYMTRLPLEKDD